MTRDDTESESTGSTPEENAATVRRLAGFFEDRDREGFDSCYADSIDVHGPNGTRTMTHDEHWEEAMEMFEAVPDLSATIENLAADGNHVFYRSTYSGTHQNEINGASPTGELLEWSHWSDYRFEDGVIVEAWQLSDRYGLYEQLGLLEGHEA